MVTFFLLIILPDKENQIILDFADFRQ